MSGNWFELGDVYVWLGYLDVGCVLFILDKYVIYLWWWCCVYCLILYVWWCCWYKRIG